MVATITMLEVHDSGPVVGFVLNKSTSGTCRETGKVIVGVHRKIETAYSKSNSYEFHPEGLGGGTDAF